jgi:GDP-L-fucose synthase
MSLANKKVVVTGGSGFIGTHVITELIDRGVSVRTHIHKKPLQVDARLLLESDIEVLENINLKNIDDCEKLIEGADYVIHLAGDIANPKYVPTDFQITLNQITLFTNVLEASHKCGVEKFFDLNSGTGYPLRNYPITEDEFWDDEPYISYYGYGWMRRYREKVMEHCSHISDMKIQLCRATAIYGPNDNFDLETCHVVPALIKRVLSGEDPFVVWGSPTVVRDFLYVKDVVKGILLVLEKGQSMKPYNLGSGDEITIGRVVDSILKATDKSPKVIYDENKPTTIPFKLASIDRIRHELGFEPDYTFDDGIKDTIIWYTNNF